MILTIDTDAIDHRCDACGAHHHIPLTALVAGAEAGDPPRPGSPDIVALPACQRCGAREFWNRLASWPGGSASASSEHKRAVNALHAALVAAGRVATSLREHFAGETLATECAQLPWSYPGEPPAPIVGPSLAGAASLVVRRARGG